MEKFFHFRIIDSVEAYFQKYGVWAVAIGGFTPLPYKVFAISAGIFEMAYFKFFVVSVLARAARFFTVSSVLYFIGPQIQKYIIRYLNMFAIFLLLMGVACIFIYKVIVKRYQHE